VISLASELVFGGAVVLGGIRVGEKKERKERAWLPRRASTDGSTCIASPL
jgi:hypothetical protein